MLECCNPIYYGLNSRANEKCWSVCVHLYLNQKTLGDGQGLLSTSTHKDFLLNQNHSLLFRLGIRFEAVDIGTGGQSAGIKLNTMHTRINAPIH